MKINKQNFYNIYLPVLIFLIAFCWKLFYIGVPYIWFDEAYMIFNAQQSVSHILTLPLRNEPNPQLFMLLVHFWIKIFGISPYSVRIIPLLFNALTAVFIYFTGKKFFSLGSGILASGIFMLSTYHFYFGIETRSYSMFSMATIVSLYCFLSLINNFENRKLLVALVLANFLLIYSHYFAWIVILMQFLVSFMYLDNKKLFKELVISMIINSIVFLSMVPLFINHFLFWNNNNLGLHQPPTYLEYFYQLSGFLNLKYSFSFIALIIFAGIINILRTKNLKKMISRELIIVFLWWFVPYTIMFLGSNKVAMFRDRYVLFNSIGLYLFIAILLNLMYNQKQVRILSILILIIMFTTLNVNSRHINYSKVQNSVNNIKRAPNNNSIILIYPSWHSQGFIYYFNRTIFEDFNNYDSLLFKNNIFPVANLSEAKEKLSRFKNEHLIYIQFPLPAYNEMFDYLDSTYTKTESSSYPELFNISVFESRSIDSAILESEVDKTN